jgi:parallel beta helix pectate lyase-like protein
MRPGPANILLTAFVLFLGLGCGTKVDHASMTERPDPQTDVFHVFPGQDIQETLDAAARHPFVKKIIVHSGTYRPSKKAEALVWFNARHDGITMEAEGEVTLTAANPEISDKNDPSYPAVVNHVVYFGDRITRKTIFRGFRITGANHFITGSGQVSPIETDQSIKKGSFFYTDGGGIKIFGESSPTIENVDVFGNYASPCGGGVSVEQLGFDRVPALFKNSIFRDNRSQITGAGIDVLPGSAAVIENCLFVGNTSNTGPDFLSAATGNRPYNQPYGSGALTVFGGSRVQVSNSTFTGNRSGVDDKGTGSLYQNTIFWMNTLTGGTLQGPRFEMDVLEGGGVQGCFIHGTTDDVRNTIDGTNNRLDPPDPSFGADFVPMTPEYARVGYRPMK